MIRPYPLRPLMLCILVLAVALGGFGCGDDDPVTPQETFEVTLEVVDTEGHIVRDLLDEYFPEPGEALWYWDGKDNAGVHLPSGIYTVILEATTADGKSVLFADAKDMYMALLQRYVHGPTDEDGLLVFTDQKLFPQLYDCQPMALRDENGEALPYPLVSIWSPTEEMYFWLYDPVNQVYQGFFVDVSAPGAIGPGEPMGQDPAVQIPAISSLDVEKNMDQVPPGDPPGRRT